MIFVLFVGLFLIWILLLSIKNNDLLSPPSIVCIVWMFSTLCAIYNIDYWGIELSFLIVILIWSGVLTFCLGYILAFNVNIKSKYFLYFHFFKKRQPDYTENPINEINIRYTIFWAFVAISALTILYQFNWIAQNSSGSDWLQIMWNYRKTNSTWRAETIEKPFLLGNLELLLRSGALLTSYIAINNFIITRNKKSFFLFIPGVLYCVDTLLNAGRGNILLYFGGLALAFYVLVETRKGWKRREGYKLIRKIGLLGICVLLMFSLSRTMVGRMDDTSILRYITSYAGGSIELFDLYLADPIPKSNIWGKETFAPFINWLAGKLDYAEWRYIPHLEFRSSNGIVIGNVYGAFRYYLQDFGYLGMYIMTLISGTIFAFVYKKVKVRKRFNVDGFNWPLYIYMIYGAGLFFHSISDYAFSMICQIAYYTKYFLFAYLFKFILVKEPPRPRNRK